MFKYLAVQQKTVTFTINVQAGTNPYYIIDYNDD